MNKKEPSLRDSLMIGVPQKYKSSLYRRDISNESISDKRKKMTKDQWKAIDVTSHMREISRLNDLINRVSTHVNFYGRLYPQKRRL